MGETPPDQSILGISPMITTSSLLLVLASALAHASWNAILKRSRDSESAIGGMMTISSLASVLLAIGVGGPFPSASATAWSLVSGVFEAAYLVTLARALDRAPLGSVYTIVRGGALLVVWPISILVLSEPWSLFGGIGTLVVLFGLGVVGASHRTAPTREVTTTTRSGLLVASLCALFVAGYHVCDKIALARGASPFAVNAISLSIGTALSMSVRRSRLADSLSAFRRQPITSIAGGMLGAGGFVLFLMAMRHSGAGLVMTLRNTSILFAQVLAFVLGESPTRLSLVGAALVASGAVLLAL